MKRKYLWPLIILCAAVLISLALVRDTRVQGQGGADAPLSPVDPNSFVFRLELDGEEVGEYTECFGLGSSNEIETTVVQTKNGAVVQKTRGALEWHNITLKRVGPSSAQIWSSWRKAVEEGRLNEAIQNGAIVMSKTGSSEALARWNFTGAWPSSLLIEGSAEELTIVHEGLERVAPNGDGGIEPVQR